MSRLVRVVGSVGAITRLWSLAFLLPALIALVYDAYDMQIGAVVLPRGSLVFLGCFAGAFLLGSLMRRVARAAGELQEREAFLTVGLGWLWLCGLGTIPFLAMGPLHRPIDAWFETMSGMTTTGATVIDRLGDVAPSLHIWRAFLQFIGGMGIIVLSVALLARLTQGGRQMLQAESPGPSMTRIAPRIAQTARLLWGVYLSLFGVLFTLMTIIISRHGFTFKQTVFEALLHSMTTIATGGFSNHDASIAFFDDWILELLIILFVLISGTNYTLLFHALRGNARPLWRDPEWRFYVTMVVGVTLALTGILWRAGEHTLAALRGAAFTTASMVTSTGYATADYGAWPAAAHVLILLLMVTGATAGSTSGGMKHVRILLIVQVVRRQFTRILHPHAVVPIRVAGRAVQTQTMMAVVAFFVAFVGMWLAGAFLLVLIDPLFVDPVDAASASIAALSNMGPALGVVGPTQTYAGVSAAGKLLLSMLMWFGRLELFTAILVFAPRAWRN